MDFRDLQDSPITSPFSPAYELVFEERPGYLYACVSAAHITPAMARNCLAEIADKCAAVECERLLIERDIPSLPTTHALVAIHDFVGMRAGSPIAFVNRHSSVGEQLRNQVEAGVMLGERVAYFDNIPAAEEWLIVVNP